MKNLITVHHLNNSRSQRILWLLEELKLDYEIKCYERHPKTMLAPPELKNIHPLGKSPVITDGNHVIAESGAIIEYLVNTYGNGKLKPQDTESALRYTYWLHYAEGSAMLPLLLELIFGKIEKTAPLLVRPVAMAISQNVKKLFIRPNLKTHFEFMESELEKTKWFAGNEFSAADVQMSFPVESGDSKGILKDKPKLKAFLNAIHSRPAYKKALERGGRFEILN